MGPCPKVEKADRPLAAGEKSTNKLLMDMLSVHSANEQMQTEHNPGDLYKRGSMEPMRMFEDKTSIAMHKRFSDSQKGEILGWSGVNRWDKVPTIWGKTKDTKIDMDLRRLM